MYNYHDGALVLGSFGARLFKVDLLLIVIVVLVLVVRINVVSAALTQEVLDYLREDVVRDEYADLHRTRNHQFAVHQRRGVTVTSD